MKKLILLFSILLGTGTAFAQYMTPLSIKLDKFNVLDSASLKFTYRFTYMRDSLKPNTTYADMHTLLIGRKISKYFSQNNEDYCIHVMKIGKYETNTDGTCGFEIFKNYPEKKMTVTDSGCSFLMGGDFLYEEDMPNLKWEIKSDTLTFLSYSCQKAITTFRGRIYEAWFTFDIPSNNGPWKFGGLPGLILKINDTKHNFVFECVGMEQLKELNPIKFYNLKYSTLSRKNLMNLYRRLFDDPDAFFKSVHSEMCGQYDPKDLPKLPYNPMELK